MDKRIFNVLIVEDEQLIAVLISDILSEFGYHIAGMTDNGNEAIRVARETKPDIVLMDIMLQGDMGGIEAADIINRELDIPVVYLTAQSDRDTVERALESNPFGFMIKPFTPMELFATMEAAGNKHRLFQAQKEIHRRDVILEAVNAAAARFLKLGRFRDYIGESMSSLGEAAGVDRLIVLENVTGEPAADTAKVIFEWKADGDIPFLFGKGNVISFTESGLGTWKEQLESGNIVAVRHDCCNQRERKFFQRSECADFLIIPVFSGEEWWGAILLDGMKRDQFWTAPEIDAFGAAASIIGSAIFREYTGDALMAYIREGALRLNSPLELVINNLRDIQQEVDDGIPLNLIRQNIGIQLATLEETLENLKDLNRKIVTGQKDIPDMYREFLQK